MAHRFRQGIAAFVLGVAVFAVDPADAHIYIASATGHATDRSSPFDGTGDTAGATGDLLNMILNASDSNPALIADRRGVFEIDMSDADQHEFLGATLQFDIFSQSSSLPVNIYLFGGNGVVGADDYARTENLAFSGILIGDEPQIDITTEVTSMLDDGQTWIGVLIAMTQEDQVLVIDNVDGRGVDPSITTKVVPEPSTLALFGLLGLTIARRRSRQALS